MTVTRFGAISALLISTAFTSGHLHAEPRHHGSASYSPGLYATAPAEGTFNRMFPLEPYGLWPQASPIYDLADLGLASGPMEEDGAEGDSQIEAGITFLGQFVDHDITLDVTTQLGIPANPDETKNFRTADLDLDCVYGGGPEATPWLYAFPKLHVGEELPGGRHDLYRGKDGTALIGDPRNDENIFVSQVQAAFIAFHNKMVDELLQDAAAEGHAAAQNYDAWKSGGTFEERAAVRALDEELFETARDHVIHYYHRMLAEYFLPKVIGVGRTLDIATNGPRFYDWRAATIPVEFSAAAYRFGHSQVREEYLLQAGGDPMPIFSGDRNGFRPVRDDEALDFALYFPINGRDDLAPQFTKKLDTKLPPALLSLDMFGVVPPGGDGSLASRNLKRGRTFRLPSGQDLFDIIVDIDDIVVGEDVDVLLVSLKGAPKVSRSQVVQSFFDPAESDAPTEVLKTDLVAAMKLVRDAPATIQAELGFPSSPLWYHVLHEAEVWPVRMAQSSSPSSNWPMEKFIPTSVAYLHNTFDAAPDRETITGQVLGPVGGTIVGEVMIGLMDNYRNKEGKGLDYPVKVEIPGTELPGFSDRFTFGDMLLFIDWDQAPS